MIRFEQVKLQRGGFLLQADFAVSRAKNWALIGPSGAGKSLLLQLLAGILRPDHGAIKIDGTRLDDFAPGAHPVGLLFQDHNLFEHLDVGQNMALAQSGQLRPDAVQRQAASGLLAQMGLAGFEGRAAQGLSGGQKARVALAMALSRPRPIIALDEAFIGLGPAQRAQLLDLTAKKAKGRQLILVSHEPDEAFQLAEQVSFVADGKVEKPRPVAEFLAEPGAAVSAYLGEKMLARLQGKYR